MRRALLTAVLLLAVAGACWLWPATLGGRTTYLVTQGTSMAPRFRSGDLAVVRPASHYAVGDVVAYRSNLLRAVVLHRIEGMRDGRYQLQGDRNTWRDPDGAAPDQIIGRLLGRVPQGGRWLVAARRPGVVVLGVAVAALATAGVRAGVGSSSRSGGSRRGGSRGGGSRRGGSQRGRGAAPRRGPAHATRAVPGGRGRRPGAAWRVARERPATPDGTASASAVLATVAACAVVGFGCLGTLAWVLPASRAGTAPVGWSQRASITYTASARPGTAYPSGRVVTGDPVFLALSPALDVAVEYRAGADGAHRFGGTRALSATLGTANGWSSDVPLVPAAAFDGDGFVVRARVDLSRIPATVRDVAATTGVPVTGWTLTVRADVRLVGAVAGQPVAQPLAAVLAFDMDDHQLRLTSAREGARTAGDPDVVRWDGSVRRPTTTPTTLELGPLRAPTASLRRWPLAAGVALLPAWALLAARIRRARRRPGGADPDLLRTAPVDLLPGRTVLDVESLAELTRVAQRYERFVLHSRDGDQDCYLVDDGTLLYRYLPGTSPPVPRPRRPQDPPPAPDRVQAFVDNLRRPTPP